MSKSDSSEKGFTDPKKSGRGPRGPGFGPGFIGGPTEKPADFKKTLKRMLVYLKPHRTMFIIVFAAAILSTAFSVLAPLLIGEIAGVGTDSYLMETCDVYRKIVASQTNREAAE